MDLKPGNRSFYKYMSPETAIAALGSKTFRYSSPLAFNDPFDIQSGLHFDFDINQLHEKVLDRWESLAKSKEMPEVDTSDPWGQVVELAWKSYKSHGFPRKKLLEKGFPKLFTQLTIEMKNAQNIYLKNWSIMLPTMRVFCVTEEKDNLLMWAHYAKDHTGLVVELLSLPEEDNPLSKAQPINYTPNPPPFFTEEEWIDEILLQKRLDENTLIKNYAQTKSEHWSYEREWRVLCYDDEKPDDRWFNIPIRKNELSAVYIGCKASDTFAMKVKELVANSFPECSIYKAQKHDVDFRLTFNEI